MEQDEIKDLEGNGVYRRHRERIERLRPQYATARSLLLPVLWMIQEEDGWIAPECMTEAAAVCGCTPAEALEVASFYQMYHRAPAGRYVFGICGTLPCALCAADGLYEHLSARLGIGWGETTADGLLTIERRECLGACSEAPVMLLNQELVTRVTREAADRLIEECRNGARQPYFTGRPDVSGREGE